MRGAKLVGMERQRLNEMSGYKPICKASQLILGEGRTIAISSGWTIANVVAKRIPKNSYAAIGQLYNPSSSIDYLIRNLLANPQVRVLVVLDATSYDKNSGSSRCLRDFFGKGVLDAGSEKSWKIDSPIDGHIGKDTPLEAIDALRSNIEVYGCGDIQDLPALIESIREDSDLPPWGEPQFYPAPEVEVNSLPGETIANRVEGETIAEAWVNLLHRTISFGQKQPTGYDGFVWEILNTTTVVRSEPENFYFPEPNFLPVTRESIASYLPQILEDSCDKSVKYTYGSRMRSHFGRDQVRLVIDKLQKERDAKSAVINLWDVEDHIHGSSPCLNHLWFRLLDDRLILSALFRSHDIFGAWVSNAFGLRSLQQLVAKEVGATPAELIITSQSCHIYEHSIEAAKAIVADRYHPKTRYDDPAGNFIVEVNERIEIVQTDKSGMTVCRFSGQSPLDLVRQVVAANPQIRPDHAAYLGMEVQKAWQARRDREVYVQDR